MPANKTNYTVSPITPNTSVTTDFTVLTCISNNCEFKQYHTPYYLNLPHIMVSYNDSLNRLLISFTQIVKVKLENDEKNSWSVVKDF